MKTNHPELDKALFRQTFSKVKASPNTIKEVITMTEMQGKPKKFILRRLAVAAIVLALAFALAMGANAATNGEFFKTVTTFVTTMQDGQTVVMGVNAKGLENTSKDSPMYIAFSDGNEEHGILAYRDENGHFVFKDNDLPEEMKGALSALEEGVETEARTSAEVE